jgi:hypothetical protein
MNPLGALLLYCVSVSAFTGSERAQVMMGRLWDAARTRADELRAAEGDLEPGAWSASDMMAKALDYTRDQLERPPLDTVEFNLLKLQAAIKALAAQVATLAEDGKVCETVAEMRLMPVQGERYTRIHN